MPKTAWFVKKKSKTFYSRKTTFYSRITFDINVRLEKFTLWRHRWRTNCLLTNLLPTPFVWRFCTVPLKSVFFLNFCVSILFQNASFQIIIFLSSKQQRICKAINYNCHSTEIPGEGTQTITLTVISFVYSQTQAHFLSVFQQCVASSVIILVIINNTFISGYMVISQPIYYKHKEKPSGGGVIKHNIN